jgi:L-fuconolactonase
MIGSDWPVCLQAASYATTLQVVTDYISGLDDDAQAAVLGNTAIEWYKLPVHVPVGEGLGQ